jgi:hypothetical protein
VIAYSIVLDLRPHSVNRRIKADRQRPATNYYDIAGRKIAVEGSGDPNTALLNKGADPVIQVNGSGGSTSTREIPWSCKA